MAEIAVPAVGTSGRFPITIRATLPIGRKTGPVTSAEGRSDPPDQLAPGVVPGELRFLYVGVDDTEAALGPWLDGLGARLRWRFQHFGADVAGLEVGTGPLVMLADHRPAGSVLPIWAVDDLAGASRGLTDRGWTVAGPLGTPEGDAIVATGPDGVEVALLEVVRPGAMDGAYADESNSHRVR